MWIIPNTHTLYSAFAADMVELNSASDLQALNIERSLMWRSKRISAKSWFQKCKRVSYLPRLFGRTLSRCQWIRFETALTSSLPVIRASHFPQPAPGRALNPKNICGIISPTLLDQSDLFGCSAKTSSVTPALDCAKSSAIWSASVIERNGEYTARLSAVRRIRGNEFSLWATGLDSPQASLWPTPTAQDTIQMGGNPDHPNRGTTLGGAVRNWATPSVDSPGIKVSRLVDKNGAPPQLGHRMFDRETGRNAQVGLTQQVQIVQRNWPTPAAHECRLGYQDRSKPGTKGTQMSLTTLVVDAAGGRSACSGQLSPNWTEWLMGIPSGWTAPTGE
jgi:hypothetical protein